MSLNFFRAAMERLRSTTPAQPQVEQKVFQEAQEAEMRNRFLAPSVDLLADCLEDFKETKKDLFEKLISLVMQENASDARRRLSIDKHHTQVDEQLLKSIAELIPSADDDTTLGIYRTLFTLLHEYRYNKNTDELGFRLGLSSSRGSLSSRVKESTQRIAEPLNDNKPCEVIELSAQQIENMVLKHLGELSAQKIQAFDSEKSTGPSASADPKDKKRTTEEADLKDNQGKKAKAEAHEDKDTVLKAQQERIARLLAALTPPPMPAAAQMPRMPGLHPFMLLLLLRSQMAPSPAALLMAMSVLSELGSQSDDDVSDDEVENLHIPPSSVFTISFNIRRPSPQGQPNSNQASPSSERTESRPGL